MFRKIVFSLCVGIFFFGVIGLSYGQVEAGNKICPVSGEKIEEEMKATYEYNGKIYNFCCASCVKEFRKDPDKYIKKVDDELKAASEKKTDEQMVMLESGMKDIQDKDSQHHSN